MIQVWMLDEDNYFTGESIFVEEVKENMTTEPLLVGYVKPKWTGREWIEGASDEEIKDWEKQQELVIVEPTEIEILQQENKLLKDQISELKDMMEVHTQLINQMSSVYIKN